MKDKFGEKGKIYRERRVYMFRKVIHSFFVISGGTLGFLYVPTIVEMMNLTQFTWLQNPYVGMVLGAIILFLLSYFTAGYIADFFKWIEEQLVRIPVIDLFFGAMGLIIGLFIAYLINISLKDMSLKFFSEILPLFLTIIIGYLGFQVGFRRREEFVNIILVSRKDRTKKNDDPEKELVQDGLMVKSKILDTSVIIDGRIADICQTNFLEGTIVIPQFVLKELQHIADSSDGLKRNRGRRGLDILNRIQKELDIKVIIDDTDFDDIQEVDSKLVKLAKVKNGIVVTNDFNLNKVCDVQGVPVLNINDLANAVKPIVLPGEELIVQVIKDGKEQKQGVAYLDDGTMIVVEGGQDFIGKTIEVVITSVLQTSAGRMIFAKPKTLEQAL